jgi:hypothetical protein
LIVAVVGRLLMTLRPPMIDRDVMTTDPNRHQFKKYFVVVVCCCCFVVGSAAAEGKQRTNKQTKHRIN